jgi:hypothetical protein
MFGKICLLCDQQTVGRQRFKRLIDSAGKRKKQHDGATLDRGKSG